MATPNFANRTLFHSDNLPILQTETVDLVAADPLFNMQSESAAKDAWDRARIAASRERDRIA